MLNLVLELFTIIASITIDLIIFSEVSKVCKVTSDYLFLIILAVLLIGIALVVPLLFFSNIMITIIEICSLYIYFGLIRKNNKKLVFGASLIWILLDLVFITIEIVYKILFPKFVNIQTDYIFDLGVNFIGLFIILKSKQSIRQRLIGNNSTIFVSILTYIWLTGTIINYFISIDKRATEIVQFSIGLLVFQTIFAILIYVEMVRTQKNLLNKEAQKRQHIQYQLTLADKEIAEAKNRQLSLQENQLKSENAQLKEYTNYLDKNEDELRRFKHDYQNILNGLRISAEKGDVQEVVKQLEAYTDNYFDEKALRKYKGVNHIHVEELKSIAIAKLAKLYNLGINYSFGCNQNIFQIPKAVDILDLTRIIGITFDNAIEESKALIKQTGDSNSARVDAMYYQEDGDFEFEIRNRVRKQNAAGPEKMSEEGYTTKKHHAGIGLSNIKQIAAKYESSVMINYRIKNGVFIFTMVVIPDGSEE